MPDCSFVVFTSPAEARPTMVNRWYEDVPLGDAAPRHGCGATYRARPDDLAAMPGERGMPATMANEVETPLVGERVPVEAAR